MTEREAFRLLELDPCARPEVVQAAFTVLRELCLREDRDDAPRRLAELNRALRLLTERAKAPAK